MLLDPRNGDYPSPGVVYKLTMTDTAFNLRVSEYVRVTSVTRHDDDVTGGTFGFKRLTSDFRDDNSRYEGGYAGFFNRETNEWYRTFEPVSFDVQHEGRFL